MVTCEIKYWDDFEIISVLYIYIYLYTVCQTCHILFVISPYCTSSTDEFVFLLWKSVMFITASKSCILSVRLWLMVLCQMTSVVTVPSTREMWKPWRSQWIWKWSGTSQGKCVLACGGYRVYCIGHKITGDFTWPRMQQNVSTCRPPIMICSRI